MFLGKVIGTVWSTKKAPDLEGVRFQKADGSQTGFPLDWRQAALAISTSKQLRMNWSRPFARWSQVGVM